MECPKKKIFHKLPKPSKDNEWDIFKNVMPTPFQVPYSCGLALNNECIRGKTSEECFNTIKEHSDFGYWVTKPGIDSYCLPLVSDYIPLNPNAAVFNNKDIDLAKDVESYYFVNTKKYPSIDYNVNIIYSNDSLSLYHMDTQSILVTDFNSSNNSIIFRKDNKVKKSLLKIRNEKYIKHISNLYGLL